MHFDFKTVVTTISMIVAAVSAFFAWQIASQDEINDLNGRLLLLENKPPAISEARVKELISELRILSPDDVRKLTAEAMPAPLGRTLPKGIIVASSVACEKLGDRWSLFEPAGGRFILGAGDHENADENRRALKIYDRPLMKGGAVTHTLAAEEIPGHKHQVKKVTIVGDARPGLGNAIVYVEDIGGAQKQVGEIGSIEPAAPHTNMPPFIALFFCKKD